MAYVFKKTSKTEYGKFPKGHIITEVKDPKAQRYIDDLVKAGIVQEATKKDLADFKDNFVVDDKGLAKKKARSIKDDKDSK